MLQTLLDTLTREQRAKLHEFGVTQQTISNWKGGRQWPTPPQVIAIASVCGVDRHELQDSIALDMAKPEQRSLLERVLGKARAVGATSLSALAMALVVAASAASSMGADVRFAARLRRARKRANVYYVNSQRRE